MEDDELLPRVKWYSALTQDTEDEKLLPRVIFTGVDSNETFRVLQTYPGYRFVVERKSKDTLGGEIWVREYHDTERTWIDRALEYFIFHSKEFGEKK